MLINLKCYHCGAEVQADDGETQVFCDACGTKLMIPVKTFASVASEPASKTKDAPKKAESGEAEKAPVPMPKSFLGGVDLYDKGEFETAYKGLLELADNDKSVWGSRLFAGLALSAMSKPLDLKFRDGITAAKNASATGYSGSDKAEVLSLFTDRLVKFVKRYSEEHYTHSGDFIYENADYAKDHFDGTCRLVEYHESCADLINQESLIRWSNLENVKKDLIKETLDYIKEVSKPIEYIIGYKTVVKGKDLIVTERVDQKMPCPFVSQYKALTEKLKTAYNSIPSTVNRLKRYDEDIAANRSIIDDYKKSSEEYFAKNPEDAKVYKRWRLFTSKKTISEIESRFPSSLLDKKTAAQRSETIVSTLIAEKKKFEKENTI